MISWTTLIDPRHENNIVVILVGFLDSYRLHELEHVLVHARDRHSVCGIIVLQTSFLPAGTARHGATVVGNSQTGNGIILFYVLE